MKTDIEIAQEAAMIPVKEVAARYGIKEDDLELYGKYKAKLTDELWNQIKDRPDGKLVLRMNFTGTYRKINSLQDTVPEIFFHNMIHFQDIGFFCIFQNTNLFLFDFFFYRPPSGKNEKRSPPASAPKTPAGEPPASYISPIAVKSI